MGNFNQVLAVGGNNTPGDIKDILQLQKTNKPQTTTILEIVYSWQKSQVT